MEAGAVATMSNVKAPRLVMLYTECTILAGNQALALPLQWVSWNLPMLAQHNQWESGLNEEKINVSLNLGKLLYPSTDMVLII
ncbi:hypothetical protein HanXRQr2_Chr11g0479571 [Helianthus annuus]|uniref:Uncharacterized protein n=1 Tax=Helianthus annuus TaxID=4232 RepID=A0A9K3MZM6_HELAN|nr:hypothetical protein HanXRQr2_Chr11g0479571 [Helianthus annuus]KAJ0874279.1 hypothetical protein HanPSC8_Chr11g0462251 [Helianthus annuus]